ncbi:MAG: Conserved putative secreted protein [Thermoleophilia bacterium]|nr:Conserved putative secreted protein [Thermoleophilia bacterium]
MSSQLRRSLVLTTLLALLLGVSGAAAQIGNPTNTKVAGIDVDATTIPELQELMNSRRMNSVQLTNFYLRRIRQLNPTLNAVITVSPTALADARAADAARRGGDDRPLLGVPIIVKDNVNTTGMPTTAGSWALAGSTPDDAFIAEQLKAAGAIIIGKANLSEWANFRSGPSSSGWSGIGGQTNMPYVLDRNPCGSSSGSGVVAAADLAVAAVGTETDGSIVCPSGANGVVGIKPTLGLWSRAGVVPISADQDTAGPMARNVTDAAVLLGAATGVDTDDPATDDQVGNAFTDYTQFLDDEALKGASIGVWRAGTFVDRDLTGPVIEPILDDAVEALEAEGATVVEGMDIDLSATAGEFPALLCEFKTDIATYLETYVDGTNPVTGQPYPQTLAELIEFNQDHPELEGPWNDLVFELAEATNGRDGDCADIRAGVTPPVQDAIDELMAENDLDAIIALTNGPAWPTNDDPNEGDLDGHFEYFVGSSTAAAVSGYGDITVPAGYIEGLPVGITFIGGGWSEPELIGFAYDYEQATQVRVPPQFIPTIGDDLFPGAPNPPDQAQAQRQQATQGQRDLVVRFR